jgi:hypothetical protein
MPSCAGCGRVELGREQRARTLMMHGHTNIKLNCSLFSLDRNEQKNYFI